MLQGRLTHSHGRMPLVCNWHSCHRVEQLRRLRGWHQLCLGTWPLCSDATVLRDEFPRLQVAKLVDSDEANCILQRCLRLTVAAEDVATLSSGSGTQLQYQGSWRSLSAGPQF